MRTACNSGILNGITACDLRIIQHKRATLADILEGISSVYSVRLESQQIAQLHAAAIRTAIDNLTKVAGSK